MSNDPDAIETEEDEECPFCSGTGMWNETVEATSDEDFLSENPCPECDGTGFVQ